MIYTAGYSFFGCVIVLEVSQRADLERMVNLGEDSLEMNEAQFGLAADKDRDEVRLEKTQRDVWEHISPSG